jgi:hypothetical protein
MFCPLFLSSQTLSFQSVLFCTFVLFPYPSPTFSFLWSLFHFRLFLIFSSALCRFYLSYRDAYLWDRIRSCVI